MSVYEGINVRQEVQDCSLVAMKDAAALFATRQQDAAANILHVAAIAVLRLLMKKECSSYRIGKLILSYLTWAEVCGLRWQLLDLQYLFSPTDSLLG